MTTILLLIIVFLLLGGNNRRSGGGYSRGYTPRQPPAGPYRIPTPPRPPGMPPFPGPFYVLKGLRFPWDSRPIWLWDRYHPWTLDQLPHGVKWADQIKKNIAKNEAQWKRPPPPAPMDWKPPPRKP